MMTNNAIEIKNLTVDFKEFSLKNINLTLPKGTVMGLIGKNGSGKSTLIKTISDCNKPYKGEILIDGITSEDDRVAYFGKLQTVFDENLFNFSLKIKNLKKLLPKSYSNFNIEYFNEKIKHFEINENTVIDKLSFGTKKKIQIIAALALNPQILVLDEPTTGIDPSGRADILDMLADFMLDENHSILMSTHITSDLDKIADYITLIDKGEIIFSEDKVTLQDNYRLIRAENDAFTEEEKQKLIGIKKNAFGIEALTRDKAITQKQGVTAVVPNVEDIMLRFTDSAEGEIKDE